MQMCELMRKCLDVRMKSNMRMCIPIAIGIKCADDPVLRSLLVEREHPELARTTPNTPEHAKKLIDYRSRKRPACGNHANQSTMLINPLSL
jgi:hypothetical protein